MIYFFNTKRILRFSNLQTYNEKLQWLKLNYSADILVCKCADKYTMRDYVKSKGLELYLVKMYGVYLNESEIEYDALPDDCMLKLSSGWDNNVVWHSWYNQNQKQEVIRKLREWNKMTFGYFTGETQYFYLVPRIICEEYLGDEVVDYKLLCFNGKVELIQVDISRYSCHKRNFYNTDWNRLNIQYGYPNSTIEIEKPKKLKEMIWIAELLSSEFIHVRIDLYYINNEIKIGEITFSPTAGFKEYEPYYFNYYLGKKICI